MEPADGITHHSNDHNLSDTSERPGLNITAVEAIEAGRVEEKLPDVGETRLTAECEPGTARAQARLPYQLRRCRHPHPRIARRKP
jgi:hypothetical protein